MDFKFRDGKNFAKYPKDFNYTDDKGNKESTINNIMDHFNWDNIS